MKIKAHVPTQQYGFIEIEGAPEDAKEIERLYNQYAESPIAFKKGGFVRLKDIFGNEIDYDADNHVYSWNGELYLSASTYAKSKQRPFDPVLMSAKVSKDRAAEVQKLWELGGQVSRDFGTVVHLALEVYGKYRELSEGLNKEYHIPNHPLLAGIVQDFYKLHPEPAKHEVLVIDHKNKKAGTIDRLLLNGKEAVVEDYKITHKDDKTYWSDQLGFYQELLEVNGLTVTGKNIHRYNGKWETIKL